MSNPYVGEIRLFAGNFAPNGWLFCQGQLVSIADYDTLFNLIGTTYGGDGVETFALPHLASRFPVGSGTGPGGSYPIGQTGGVEAVVLTPLHLPNHSHRSLASGSAASTTSPSGATWAAGGQRFSTASPDTSMSAAALAPAGGNQPHDNMPPYLALNFIISLYGIYPSPS